LKHDPRVRHQINRLWLLLPKTERGAGLDLAGYRLLMLRVCKVLNPDFRYEQARAVVDQDFARDTQHNTVMTYEQFAQSMFELADVWCPDIRSRPSPSVPLRSSSQI
jgi:hypothetical protein